MNGLSESNPVKPPAEVLSFVEEAWLSGGANTKKSVSVQPWQTTLLGGRTPDRRDLKLLMLPDRENQGEVEDLKGEIDSIFLGEYNDRPKERFNDFVKLVEARIKNYGAYLQSREKPKKKQAGNEYLGSCIRPIKSGDSRYYGEYSSKDGSYVPNGFGMQLITKPDGKGHVNIGNFKDGVFLADGEGSVSVGPGGELVQVQKGGEIYYSDPANGIDVVLGRESEWLFRTIDGIIGSFKGNTSKACVIRDDKKVISVHVDGIGNFTQEEQIYPWGKICGEWVKGGLIPGKVYKLISNNGLTFDLSLQDGQLRFTDGNLKDGELLVEIPEEKSPKSLEEFAADPRILITSPATISLSGNKLTLDKQSDVLQELNLNDRDLAERLKDIVRCHLNKTDESNRTKAFSSCKITIEEGKSWGEPARLEPGTKYRIRFSNGPIFEAELREGSLVLTCSKGPGLASQPPVAMKITLENFPVDTALEGAFGTELEASWEVVTNPQGGSTHYYGKGDLYVGVYTPSEWSRQKRLVNGENFEVTITGTPVRSSVEDIPSLVAEISTKKVSEISGAVLGRILFCTTVEQQGIKVEDLGNRDTERQALIELLVGIWNVFKRRISLLLGRGPGDHAYRKPVQAAAFQAKFLECMLLDQVGLKPSSGTIPDGEIDAYFRAALERPAGHVAREGKLGSKTASNLYKIFFRLFSSDQGKFSPEQIDAIVRDIFEQWVLYRETCEDRTT